MIKRMACGGIVLLLIGGGSIAGRAAAADRAGPIRIGVLTESWGPTPASVGLRDGLQHLGYRENEQFVIGVRFTQGDTAALPVAARDLVQQGVDLIFTSGTHAAAAARAATDRIPIVFTQVGDPEGQGLIQSFPRPGGNITGIANLNLELAVKRLEVFREIIPGLKRVLFPYDANDPYAVKLAQAYRETSRRFGVGLVERPVRTQAEAQAALANLRQGEVDGILSPTSVSLNIPGFLLEARPQQAAPTMFSIPFFVDQGGLASYGPNLYASGRQAARLADKILKGASPAGIPVEVNNTIEFVINLKTARALGLTISPEVLYRADRLIR